MNSPMNPQSVLATRTPRELSEGEKTFVKEHTDECLQCLKHSLGKDPNRCESMQLWLTDPEVYTFYENEERWNDWHQTKAAWLDARDEQRAKNPLLHRRFADGVRWLFLPHEEAAYPNGWSKADNYVRVEWAVSSLQIIVGSREPFNKNKFREQLIFHEYAQIE